MWKKIFISVLVSVFVFGSGGIESTRAVRPLTQEEMGAAVGGTGDDDGETPNTHDMAVTKVWCASPAIPYRAPSSRPAIPYRAFIRRMGQRPNHRYPYGGEGFIGTYGGMPLVNTLMVTIKNKGTYNENDVKARAEYKSFSGDNWGDLGPVSAGKFLPNQRRSIGLQWICDWWLDPGWYKVTGISGNWPDDNWDNNSLTVEVILRSFLG